VTEAPFLTRRDRMRAATMEEITATARRLLVEQGPEAASLRAIAREMGMTAPGLYRYYSSREELLRHVKARIFRELASDIHRAINEAAVPGQPGRPGRPEAEGEAGSAAQGQPGGESHQRAFLAAKMVAACQEFRRWALNHKDEFALLFGVPLPGFEEEKFDIAQECALEFAGTFYALFLELWQKIRFPVPDPSEIDPSLRDQLGRFRDTLRTDAPCGAVLTFLRCWMLLYGAVAMEVFGHLGFALDDPAPMFEIALGDLAARVGLEYPLPAP
jgi:AcrR family transcriptional regulator